MSKGILCAWGAVTWMQKATATCPQAFCSTRAAAGAEQGCRRRSRACPFGSAERPVDLIYQGRWALQQAVRTCCGLLGSENLQISNM